jgi:hypothetical protein
LVLQRSENHNPQGEPTTLELKQKALVRREPTNLEMAWANAPWVRCKQKGPRLKSTTITVGQLGSRHDLDVSRHVGDASGASA